MRTNELRAGVIGCGAIGSHISDDIQGASIRMGLPYGHAPVYQFVNRTALVAGSDTDAGRRDTFAQRWSVDPNHMYSDYREMLEREHLDLVSVATPSPLHAEMAEQALKANVRGIFLEKPIANSLEKAYQLNNAVRKSGVPVSVNHTRRGDPLYRKARQLIVEGVIGELHSMIAQFSGGLMWNGTHAFDILNFFNCDIPASWIQGQLDDEPEQDPGGSAYFVYENGVRAFVNGTTGNPVLFRIEVMGSLGRIVIGNYDLELWKMNSNSDVPELVLHPFPQVMTAEAPMVFLLEELIDAVEFGTPLISNCDTAISALELIVGVHSSSSRGGARVALPPDDQSLTIQSL